MANLANMLNPHPTIDMVQLIKGTDALDVRQNNWGTLNFHTGQTYYTDDRHPANMLTVNNPPQKVIGTTCLTSCTGIVILTQTRAIVGHYSDGFIVGPNADVSFIHYLVQNADYLRNNARAWIMHCRNEPNADARSPTGGGGLGGQLYVILRDRVRMPLGNITVLKYEQPPEPVLVPGVKDPWGDLGEGSIIVDGRNSPAQMATVYAQGYKQL
ncbi:hypothetical protein ANO14919_087940 [Xylariales sp. No.14919]|nr:hypothetical protein ANO14919_087940 [Xylariales sp. No.14919]